MSSDVEMEVVSMTGEDVTDDVTVLTALTNSNVVWICHLLFPDVIVVEVVVVVSDLAHNLIRLYNL